MLYRTDLAIESMELIESGMETEGNIGKRTDIPGIEIEEEKYDNDIKVTRIEIINETGEVTFGKKRGNYITIEVDGIVDEADGIKERASSALGRELGMLCDFRPGMKVFVVGLGNDLVTPDALGPYTVSKVRVTRHLFEIFGYDEDSDMSNVSSLIPGVTGSTGIETAEIIRKASEIVKPDYVIIVDSLAARNIARVNTTIQINDTGISPGSGMGNKRKELTEESLGCKVIAVGVPTVIDAGTLIIDALTGFEKTNDEIAEYLQDNPQELVVTSTDIDMVIKDFSDIIANGINITLHPGIYS